MRRKQQPTATSCGPTCVAMIADKPVSYVLYWLPRVRIWTRKQKLHYTNVGEMRELLHICGFKLSARKHGRPPTKGTILLSLKPAKGQGHWSVLQDGRIYDPYFSWMKTLAGTRRVKAWTRRSFFTVT